jgi:pterin-4a-carbinolamine dehydratase
MSAEAVGHHQTFLFHLRNLKYAPQTTNDTTVSSKDFAAGKSIDKLAQEGERKAPHKSG